MVGHGPSPPNGLKEDADIAVGNHSRPQEESAMTTPNTDRPSSVTPHPEDYVSDNGVADHANVAPDVQPVPQTVPLHPEIQPKLDHEDASNATGLTGGVHRSEGDGTEDEEDEDEGDEDDNEEDEDEDEEDEDEDEDEEPALKYERFGGAFQDLLKKDSASTLVVSNKYLVRCYYHAIVSADSADIAM
jgi:hypothetical protein